MARLKDIWHLLYELGKHPDLGWWDADEPNLMIGYSTFCAFLIQEGFITTERNIKEKWKMLPASGCVERVNQYACKVNYPKLVRTLSSKGYKVDLQGVE